MGTSKNLKKEFPSVLDSAYEQYKRDLLRYKKVAEIMTANVVTIDAKASMRDAAIIMGKKHIGSLIAKKYGTAVGIVTERDLLTKVLSNGKDPAKVKVEKVMTYPLITISSSDRIKEAAKMMYRKKGRLVVFDGGKLQGIITASDLIRSMPEVPETQVQVDDFMTQTIVSADEKVPVREIVKTMGEERIGSVVITRNDKPFGIFTERDLLSKIIAFDKSLDAPIVEATSSPLITTPAGTSIHNVAAAMAMKHVKRMPVEVQDKTLVGIITARDLVEAYAR